MISPRSSLPQIPQKKIQQFQKKILMFYKKNARQLPWRETTDPYRILLSELMLQQTQVIRVIPYYTRWISRWPTIEALASATKTEVLKEWMGLGYNTRAIHFHNAARLIVTRFEGNVLDAMDNYKQIPGVGRYTSQAVIIFSTNADRVTVDTNIRRIFLKQFNLPCTVSDNYLWILAERCLPLGKSRDWHNALMDYGALLLTARRTGIKPKTTQSRFTGSDRQIRAEILRMLLQKDTSIETLCRVLHVDQHRLSRILTKLLSEGIITKNHNLYTLHE